MGTEDEESLQDRVGSGQLCPSSAGAPTLPRDSRDLSSAHTSATTFPVLPLS